MLNEWVDKTIYHRRSHFLPFLKFLLVHKWAFFPSSPPPQLPREVGRKLLPLFTSHWLFTLPGEAWGAWSIVHVHFLRMDSVKVHPRERHVSLAFSWAALLYELHFPTDYSCLVQSEGTAEYTNPCGQPHHPTLCPGSHECDQLREVPARSPCAQGSKHNSKAHVLIPDLLVYIFWISEPRGESDIINWVLQPY